jgi:hypothetical protein
VHARAGGLDHDGCQSVAAGAEEMMMLQLQQMGSDVAVGIASRNTYTSAPPQGHGFVGLRDKGSTKFAGHVA